MFKPEDIWKFWLKSDRNESGNGVLRTLMQSAVRYSNNYRLRYGDQETLFCFRFAATVQINCCSGSNPKHTAEVDTKGVVFHAAECSALKGEA